MGAEARRVGRSDFVSDATPARRLLRVDEGIDGGRSRAGWERRSGQRLNLDISLGVGIADEAGGETEVAVGLVLGLK